ncbi:MAG: hypothetical protein GYA76_02465, partial [Verrucomicrobia bacterium]|nr:hypothetical protein [Verrucomicrobiota bacterium]
YYRSDIKFSPGRVQSENELPDQQPGNRTLDGAELKALRRAASRLEDPERGVTFRVTEDGQAIVTGPARFHIPDRFQRFAEENGLTFKAERGSARMRPNGEPERTRLGAMPENYRGDGALYAQEMRDNYDRTGLARFSPAREYIAEIEGLLAKIKASDNQGSLSMVETNLANIKRGLAGEIVRDEQGNLLAPNGRKSKLTEKQYLQVRTPAFRKWFGDWLSFHNAKNGNGVWTDGDKAVSKIVDENGEPLVVYHGTEKGGFTVMRPDSGDKHRLPMLFAAATRQTARTYSWKGDEINLNNPVFDGTVIRKVGKDWFVVQKSGDPSEAYNVYGDLVDVDQAEGYVSKKEAEYFRDNELEQYLRDNGDVRAGIYSMYLNLRNPAEEDFEGANWNGDAFDLHEVLDANGDNIYADDGRRLMPQDEAEELAEQNEGAEVSSVEWIGETTNTVAEDAKRMGNDGAIIRQVEDDGGRYPGGVLRPDDVFVFFDSNQAKSATQNTGAFSQKNDDLRYSPPRWYFSPLEKAFESAPDKVFGQAPQVKLWLAGNKAKLGLKDDEIFWTGINDWLDMQGKQKVSKADVLGYLAGSGVQVEEVMKGESGLDENGGLYVGSYDDEWAIYRTDDGDSADPVGGTYASQEDAEEDLLAMQNDNPTKFGQYTLPGGTNYRELLLTLPAAQKPDITASQEEKDAWRTKADKEYRSGHWQEPNILAHIRMNDRTDADGNKVLFIEEVQSDWGQEGKRRGFLDGNKARYEAEYRDYADELMAKYGVSPTSAGAIMSLRKAMSSDERAKLKELNDKIVAQSASVQSAPFVTDTKAWLALAVKRIMAYAAANGYEKVAFIDGQQSTDRYWKHELIAPAVDRWNEITKPESVRELGDNIFGREMYSLMSLNHMDAGVLPMVKHDQVRKSIVSRIPVDVVDVLSSNGVKAEELFSNGDVVFDRLPVSYRSRAATAFGAAIGQTSASIRAKLSGIESGGSDFEVLPALRASDLGPRELVGILDPQRLFHGGSGLGSEKTTPASAVAKSALLEKGDGLKGQFGSAELAKLLNAHVELRYGREGLLKHSVEPEPGQGMKTFYDRIVPQVVSDQLKKVGGKMEGVRINTKGQDSDFPDFVKAGVMNAVRTEQLAFTVTPKMSEPLPLFSTRRALDGYFSDNDHVVPDIAPWTTNTQLVDLAYLNGKPIRLNVGRDNGPGSGFGAMHIARNEDRDPRRAVEKETDDRGENVVRSVLKALSTAGGILHKNGEKYVLRLPMANKALVLADNGNHYSVITVLPAAQNKYGVADWTGRLTFPATADATSAEPLSPTGAKSSLASRSGMGSFVSARFDIKPPTGFNQPTTRVVVRKTRAVDPEAMAADGIKRSTPRSQMTGQPILGTWAATEVSSFDNIARQLQDKQIDTKRVVAEIRAAGKAIHDAIDPYLQEILYHGRAAKRTQDFAEQELRPLLQGMQLRGVSMQEIEDYLWAKHAPERNAQNAKTGFTGAGSGLTDAEARTILSGQAVTKNGRDIQLDAAKMPTYAALAQQVKAINDKTLDALVAYGLETQATIDQWKKTYQNYVPLMRDMTDDNYSGANNRGLGTGKGVSVRGAASKRALGSERGVIDIVANIAMQRERAITRGEKSRVSQATYGLAVSAPNPDFWLPIDPAMAKDPTAVARMESALIQMGIHPIDAQNIAREPVQSYIDPRTGMAATRINPVLRGREDVLATRINGEDKFLLFSSDERAQNMVRNLKNLDDDQLGGFLQTSAKITRWFAAVNTQYNPVFGLVNGVRDFGSAMLNLSSTPLQGKQKRVAGYGLDALRGIYADLRDHRAGRATSSRWALEFEEFAKEGGQTGYRDMFNTSEQRTEALADELKALSQGNGKWLKINEKNPVFAWLSDYNTAVENAFRVAAYKVAKESGMSKQQAAALAKNLTVNFNKKGLAATQTGALYAFFNAAVQGTARIGSTLLEHRGDPSDYRNLRLSSMGKKIVLGGVMLGVMQALMGALAGWDDDEPKQFQRERNLIIPLPGTDNYVSIPYPLGFHVLPNVGRIVTEFALSGFKDPGKRLTQLLGSMSEAFNPLGSSGLSLQTIAPTFADPLVALATNTDWNGQKIAKEDFNQNHPTPGWSRTKDTATPWSKALAYGLNYISGGGEYGKGLVSPTPDQIDYLIGQAIGGVGREAGKVAQTVTTTAKGEELPMYKIPVVGRFAGETTGVGPESGKYYDNLQRVGEHADPIKRMREDRKNAEVMEYFKAHPEARLIHAADKAQRDISELRTVKRKLEKAEAPQERINAISEQIKTRMRMFNNQVKLLEKEAA